MRTRLSQRPKRFTIDRSAAIHRGLMAGYFGHSPGSTQFRDSGPFGKHGTLTGYTGAGDTPTDRWQRDSYLRRQVLGLDGNNSGSLNTGDDHVSLALSTSSTSWSIAMWVRSTANYNSNYLFDSSAGRTLFGWGSDSVGKIGYYDGTSWRDFGNTPTALTWHHLFLQAVGTSVLLLVDGVQLGTTLSCTARSIGGTVSIGSRYSALETKWLSFAGAIADVMVHSPALSVGMTQRCADPAWSIDYGGLIQPTWRRVFGAGVVESTPPTANRRRRFLIGACSA